MFKSKQPHRTHPRNDGTPRNDSGNNDQVHFMFKSKYSRMELHKMIVGSLFFFFRKLWGSYFRERIVEREESRGRGDLGVE